MKDFNTAEKLMRIANYCGLKTRHATEVRELISWSEATDLVIGAFNDVLGEI